MIMKHGWNISYITSHYNYCCRYCNTQGNEMYSKYSRVQLNEHDLSEDVGGIHQEFLDRHTTDDTLRSEASNAESQSNGPYVAEENNTEEGEEYMQMPIQESSACQCQCYHWCCSVCSSCCGALYYRSCIGPCDVGYTKVTETTSTECKSCEVCYSTQCTCTLLHN